MTTVVDFDAPRDVTWSNPAEWGSRVLHVFDGGWHGIRSATGCLPGRKLAISHAGPFEGEGARHVVGLIHHFGIRRVIFQGFSPRAHELAVLLHHDFGDALDMFAVTHVSPAQFEHRFEMDMLRDLFTLRRKGVLKKVGSVKPGFGYFFPDADPTVLVNAPPRHLDPVLDGRDRRAVFVPVENTWRKNLYVNVLAAVNCAEVRRIYTVNDPTGLDAVADLSKLRVIGFMPPATLFDTMSSVAAVMNLTLVECQPMTKLEAAAVGTPCLTGRLGVPGLSAHPYTELTEFEATDRPDLVSERLARIVGMWRADPDELTEMAIDYAALCTRLCHQSYAEFLEV